MLIKSIVSATCACLAVVSFNANAALVKMVIEGDFSLIAGADEYNLDGAHFEWAIRYDSEMLPRRTDVSADYVIATYEGYSTSTGEFDSTVKLTNRSGGANDGSVSLNPDTIWTWNYIFSNRDKYYIFSDSAITSGEFAGLLPDDSFYFQFYESAWGVGYGSLLESFSSDAVNVSMGNWFNTSGTVYYQTENVTARASVVPVPPAVWLFGSGLIGLIGVARRR